jgi:thiamine-phosphate pyrophosphorylase
MARCYSGAMPPRQPLPAIWLVSDARGDIGIERALARLPRGSGLIFRHYHLCDRERRARFERLARLARRLGHRVVLAEPPRRARAWGAGGSYGPPERLARGPAALRLVTAHSLREIAAARRARADAIVLSPVFATRSHPGASALGPLRFRLLAARAGVPVIALGGMTARRARRIGATGWAAIDGLIPRDS